MGKVTIHDGNDTTSRLSYQGKPIHVHHWLTCMELHMTYGDMCDIPSPMDIMKLDTGDSIQVGCSQGIMWLHIVERIDFDFFFLCKPIRFATSSKLPFDFTMDDYFLIHHQHIIGFRRKRIHHRNTQISIEDLSICSATISSMSRHPQTSLS